MSRAVVLLLVALGAPAGALAQIPEKFENLQVFPPDIPRRELIQRMREFSFALGVRCEHCHEEPAEPVANQFASDARRPKRQARAMLRMVSTINSSLLAALPTRAAPRVSVDCVTCHRGSALPKTLQTTLFETATASGADAAIAQYRKLRASDLSSGRYDFGEWEINELARRLTEAGHAESAMAILSMNREYHAESADIEIMIGDLHRARGERDLAAARFRAALAKSPGHEGARRRLDELEK